MKRIFVSAVVVAAGKGTRMKSNFNKLYLSLDGIPVLAKTLLSLENSKRVNEIVLVVNESEIEYCYKNFIEQYDIKKVKSVVEGGFDRQESVYNGIVATNEEADIILIQDGARPFIKEKYIEDSIEGALEYGAACIGVRVKDTIKQVDNDGIIIDSPDRDRLWPIQTPQAFKRNVIFEGHGMAIADGFRGTDDSVLAERIGYQVKMVEGDYENIKITTPIDLEIAKTIV